MRIWRIVGFVLLGAVSALPCAIGFRRTPWHKKPGSESGLFAFEQNGRVGFIDRTGKIVIPPKINARILDVGDFSNGLARVEHQGYIDESGRFVIKNKLAWEDFDDGVARIPEQSPSPHSEGRAALLDPTGRIIGRIPMLRTGRFSENLAAFTTEGRHGGQEPGSFAGRYFPGPQGFRDKQGNVVIEPKFADVGPFRNGLARAALDGACHRATASNGQQGTPTTGYANGCFGAPPDAVSSCKVGFLNKEGQFAIQPRFESAQDFQEQLAAVRIGGQWGFIDSSGAVVIQPQFEQVDSFREGLAGVKVDGKWGFIDASGKITIQPSFKEIEPFSDSMALIYQQAGASYIDRSGRIQIRGPFRQATSFVNGLAAVLVGEGHVAYIDYSGKTVFEYSPRRIRGVFFYE